MPDSTTLPKTKRGLARREQILRAAEKIFGEMGYAEASISDITREANTAQGTLYIYFKGKDEVFSELVQEMGRLTRETIAQAIGTTSSRLEAERRGLKAFLHFVADRPGLYSIVEQARFVNPKAYDAYFAEFAAAYRIQLEAAQKEGQIKPGENEIRAWALMGVAKTLGERFILMRQDYDLDQVAEEAFSLIRHGLETE